MTATAGGSAAFANGIVLADVESAATGVFGVEVGTGISIQLGQEFGSVSEEESYVLYSEYRIMKASVDYRLCF